MFLLLLTITRICMKHFVFSCLLFFAYTIYGQVPPPSPYLTVVSAEAKKAGEVLVVQVPAGSTGLTIRCESTGRAPASLELNIIAGMAYLRQQVNTDEHAAGNQGYVQYNFMVVESTWTRLELPVATPGKYHFIFQKVPGVQEGNSLYKNDHACDMPTLVLQSQWRTGLPAPVPGRTATITRHCIVHHSAGGNNTINYTQLVRDYYVQHTQVNGWDDIGYNYLVAANGTVYAGRDPEQQGIAQDNVLGAHFCGKNSFTMGVCVMGDYTNLAPSAQAMASLNQLLSWKMWKDRIPVFDSLPHPGAGDPYLQRLAGHRDGCATSCPGNLLYAQLPAIRTTVKSNIDSCNLLTVPENGTTAAIRIAWEEDRYLHLVPVSDEIFSVYITDILGRQVFDSGVLQQEQRIVLPQLVPGIYKTRIEVNRVVTRYTFRKLS